MNDLRKELLDHVEAVRHYLHLQYGKPEHKSVPEIALDNLKRLIEEKFS